MIKLISIATGFLFIAVVALAECPEGKSEVVIKTPSGKENIHCVADQAIPGLENAAEHSSATIIPATCPCWSVTDIASFATNFPKYFYCIPYKNTEYAGDECRLDTDIGYKVIYSWGKPLDYGYNICTNNSLAITVKNLTEAEVNACAASMTPYF